jgi:hypothetical protein
LEATREPRSKYPLGFIEQENKVQFTSRSLSQQEYLGPEAINRATISATPLDCSGLETFDVADAGTCRKLQNQLKKIKRCRVVWELHEIYVDRKLGRRI